VAAATSEPVGEVADWMNQKSVVRPWQVTATVAVSTNANSHDWVVILPEWVVLFPVGR